MEWKVNLQKTLKISEDKNTKREIESNSRIDILEKKKNAEEEYISDTIEPALQDFKKEILANSSQFDVNIVDYNEVTNNIGLTVSKPALNPHIFSFTNELYIEKEDLFLRTIISGRAVSEPVENVLQIMENDNKYNSISDGIILLAMQKKLSDAIEKYGI